MPFITGMRDLVIFKDSIWVSDIEAPRYERVAYITPARRVKQTLGSCGAWFDDINLQICSLAWWIVKCANLFPEFRASKTFDGRFNYYQVGLRNNRAGVTEFRLEWQVFFWWEGEARRFSVKGSHKNWFNFLFELVTRCFPFQHSSFYINPRPYVWRAKQPRPLSSEISKRRQIAPDHTLHSSFFVKYAYSYKINLPCSW